MARQRNVQVQVIERAADILATARSFRTDPQRFEWLRALLASRGLDARAGILAELHSVPDQGCWVHYGMWLTSSGTFLKFVADETYGTLPYRGSGLLESSEVEDVSAQVSTDDRIPGIGKPFGRLAVDALHQLGMAER